MRMRSCARCVKKGHQHEAERVLAESHALQHVEEQAASHA